MISIRIVAFSSLLCLTADCLAQPLSSRFVPGDTTSETAAHVSVQNSETGSATNGLPFHRLEKDGQLTFLWMTDNRAKGSTETACAGTWNTALANAENAIK